MTLLCDFLWLGREGGAALDIGSKGALAIAASVR